MVGESNCMLRLSVCGFNHQATLSRVFLEPHGHECLLSHFLHDNSGDSGVCLLALQGSNVMEDQDLREIGITDTSHRKKILHAARAFPKVTSPDLLNL